MRARGLGVQPWKKWGLPPPKSEASGGDLSLVDYEVYTGLEVSEWPFFVRLDGWAFHALTERLKLRKPFDRRFATALCRSAETIFALFNPALCYIFSDELNFLFLQPTAFQRVEKIDSLFAGVLSARFTEEIRAEGFFDCRVIPVGRKKVTPYLIWRQAECTRNYNNSWARWALIRKAQMSPRTASKRLEGMKTPQLLALCRNYGIRLEAKPAWQRRGVLLYLESYRKRGYNPLTRRAVVVERHRVKTDWAPPLFGSRDGRELVERVLRGGRIGARNNVSNKKDSRHGERLERVRD
jgi:tRNA(His) guanylyltransferase